MDKETKGKAAFAAAASSAPVAMAASGACGLTCASCPLGGACIIGAPMVFGMAMLLSKRKVKGAEGPPVD